MAEVVLASASERQKWSTNFLKDYVRESGYMPYMGTGERNIFRIMTGEAADASVLNIPIIGALRGRGVQDSEVLEGNEEDLENANDQIRLRWKRNGVTVPKSTSYRTEIDLLDAARDALRGWAAELIRDDISAALGSIIVPGLPDENGLPGTDSAVSYAAATAAQRNAYLTANSDRILFGNSKANASSNNWATALGTVDSTNDKLTTANISLMRRMVRTATDYRMRPFRTEDGREYFVLFAAAAAFRDLKTDPIMTQANRDARQRGLDNPIFQDGDLIWDGVIVRELPELPVLQGVGTAGIDVARNFMCGQSAVGIGWGQKPTARADLTRDYSFRPSVGIEELRGQKKISRSGKNFAVAELITSAAADA